MNLTYKHKCISASAMEGGCPVGGQNVFVPSGHQMPNEVIVPEVRCKHTGSVLKLVAIGDKKVSG